MTSKRTPKKTRKSQAQNEQQPPKAEARGIIVLSDENALEDAARQLAADFDASITKSINEL